MKKVMLLALVSMMIGMGNLTALAQNTFEGEMVSKCHSVQKAKSQVTTKNVLAKMIVKNIMKKNFDNNPGFYTGTYTATTVVKGEKTRVHNSYNNCYTLIEKEGDKMKTTTYFPYIKKGYTQITDMTENQKQVEEMRKGEVEKTGETMTILGHKCDVYKVKYEVKTDSAGTTSATNLHNEFAVYDDPSMPGADQECLPGVKGVPLKVTVNTASQITNEMMNIDFLMSVATIVTAITPRTVDDAEFEVPADIKMIDIEKKPKELIKMLEDNKKYMIKKNLWTEESPDEAKIYDDLSEDWDY
ncbi:MAG: hypothetical protein IJV44_09035 [Prevotella sp.]|nr:hypothetical protein [Prevotella sp.]